MQANRFYQTVAGQAVPILLLGCVQWQEEVSQELTKIERNYLEAQQFSGKLGEVGLLYSVEGTVVKACLGMGDGTDAQAIAHGVNRLPAGCYQSTQALSFWAQVMWSLAQYRFDQYKNQECSARILVISSAEGKESVLTEASAVFLVRDLINRPANDLTPEALGEVLATLASQHGGVFQQWVGEALLEEGYPAIHAVGRAGESAPRLLSLNWGKPEHPRVTLVGKGVCFDSGGLDIKPCQYMRLMKKDMGGAAQVIGLAQWLMAREAPIRLQVLIPAVENAISANAYRPGDVLTMRSGLSVEIDNTDAEGRLVLADALTKACEDSPDLLINFATLTGAARVAVGTEISALFTPDDALAGALSEIAAECHDPMWRLPLYSGYASMLDSSVADLANSSASSYAGAITAALFLQRFIQGVTSWAHLDVMAWNVSNKPGRPEGGEAMGMRAVGRYILKRYGNSN